MSETRRPDDTAADLADLLARTPPHLSAVADGAVHDDLPGSLAEVGLASRPLYTGAMERAGPHLVALADRPAIDALLAVLGDRPIAVFWSWPGAGPAADHAEAIFVHLRRLGRIEVPKPFADGSGEEVDRVVFRHADPSALMKVLPVLDETQREAFMGAARGLVLIAHDRAGRGRIVRMPRDGRILHGAG